jgi:hypothetical protein
MSEEVVQPEEKLLYRILAQNNTISINATTSVEMTAQEAADVATQEVLLKGELYHNFFVQPISTANGWKYGHINFCPRCGCNIHKEMGDSQDVVNNSERFNCPKCGAYVDVTIFSTPEDDQVACVACGEEKDTEKLIKNDKDEDICLECVEKAEHI